MLGDHSRSRPGVEQRWRPITEIATSSRACYVVEPDVHGDERGFFVETYRREWFPQRPRDDPGQPRRPPGRRHRRACTTTCTRPTTGTCPFGRARVVLHDLRDGSPTDGATLALDLGARADGTHDHRGVFIPPGVAHGFAALTDMTITYLVDGYYNPADELGVAWDDPAIAADWGVTDPMLSERDQRNPGAPRSRRACRPHWPHADLSRWQAPRHRRRRVHRFELRAPRARQHRRRGHGLRRAHLRRQPRQPCATSTTTRATRS